MEKMALDDFIRYAKEQFDCEISVNECGKPDTFADIFGASFLNDKNGMEMVEGFAGDVSYENISIDVQFDFEDGMNAIYSGNVGLAA